MEESKLEGISKEWLNSYSHYFRHFGRIVLRLKLCTTPSFWWLDSEVLHRVERLGSQFVSKGKGY